MIIAFGGNSIQKRALELAVVITKYAFAIEPQFFFVLLPYSGLRRGVDR
jgi:hypothetical protein